MYSTEELLKRLRAKYPDKKFARDPESGMIGFEFEDMWISDPWISECGRFPMDPRYYGLTIPTAIAIKGYNLPLEIALDAAIEAERKRAFECHRAFNKRSAGDAVRE